jgi:hypothetical protein
MVDKLDAVLWCASDILMAQQWRKANPGVGHHASTSVMIWELDVTIELHIILDGGANLVAALRTAGWGSPKGPARSVSGPPSHKTPTSAAPTVPNAVDSSQSQPLSKHPKY